MKIIKIPWIIFFLLMHVQDPCVYNCIILYNISYILYCKTWPFINEWPCLEIEDSFFLLTEKKFLNCNLGGRGDRYPIGKCHPLIWGPAPFAIGQLRLQNFVAM